MEDDDGRCEGKAWGFLATSVSDAGACVADCRQQFLTALSPKDETIERVCELFSDKDGEADQMLHRLYCCDAQLCGVDNLESSGEDPNVNWVINTCSSVGYSNVRDPGPPSKGSHNCDLTSLFGEQNPRCRKKAPGTSRVTSIEQQSFTLRSTSTVTMATPTQSSIFDPSLAASVDPDRASDEEAPDTGLSTGVKVTIGLASVAAVLLAGLVALLVIRNRNKPPHRRRTLGQLLKRDGSPTQAGSPTPLVSPTISHAATGPDGTPLTPPPPLKARKMLDAGVNSRPSSASQARPPRPGFPASPLFALTMNKLVPRPDRVSQSRLSPPSSPLGWVMNATTEGSLRSFSSNPTTTASITSVVAPSRSERIVSAPGRPRRPPAGTSLDALAPGPPGPPPNKALPSTPPSGQTTQLSSCASSTRHGDIGVAIGVVHRNPADGVVLAKQSRDLCDLTEQYRLDSRGNSLGSWRGDGGGGPGPAMSTPKKRDVHSPVMKEGDLERLGGKY